MATVSFVTPEEHQAALLRIDRLEKLLTTYVHSHEEWLPTTLALAAAGVKRRETLVKYVQASAPGAHEANRITYRKEGTMCPYARSSCIDYRQRRLRKSTLN